MIEFFLPALLMNAAPEPCKLPESMPAQSERVAGEGEPGWCLKGVDPLAVAGPDLVPLRQWLVTDDAVDSVQLVQWRRNGADPMPGDWRETFKVAATATSPGEFSEVLVQRAGDNLIVVTVNPAWRVGNAVCFGEGGPMSGYLPAGVEASEADRDAIERMTAPRQAESPPAPDSMATVDNYDVLETLTGGGGSSLNPSNMMCTLLTLDGDVYRPRFHGPGGRPMFDYEDYYDEMHWRPMAPGDIARHMRVSR